MAAKQLISYETLVHALSGVCVSLTLEYSDIQSDLRVIFSTFTVLFWQKYFLYSIGRFWNCSIYWVKNIFNKMFQKWTQNPQNLVNNEHSHPLNNPSKVTWIWSKIPVQSYAWKIARSLKSWITHYRKLSSIYSELSIKKYII